MADLYIPEEEKKNCFKPFLPSDKLPTIILLNCYTFTQFKYEPYVIWIEIHSIISYLSLTFVYYNQFRTKTRHILLVVTGS